MGERWSPKPEVAGSIPAAPAINQGKIMDDPRQKMFTNAVSSIKKKFDAKANDAENLMTASCVDLGRLQDTIMELMDKGELKDEREIAEFIGASVQRPKSINVEPWKDDFNNCTRYKIILLTKDDYGYYEYKFNTRLTKKDKGD